MAKSSSFDIVSEVDLQEIDNSVNQAMKDIQHRYDLKGTSARVEFNRNDENITIQGDSEYHFNQCLDILHAKMVSRKISPMALNVPEQKEDAIGGSVRCTAPLVNGMTKDQCHDITRRIKEMKLKKINAQIQDGKVRITAPSRDACQDLIQTLKEAELDWPLQFDNFK